MVWGFFDTAAAFALGDALAQLCLLRLPPGSPLKGQQAAVVLQWLQTQMAQHLATFKQHQRLNFYQKAQMIQRFRRTLEAAGFERKRLQECVSWLVQHA